MKERTLFIFKVLSTHIILLPVLLSLSLLIPSLSLPIISIAQTILLITFLSGYWEFFGRRFRIVYSGLIEILILLLVYLDYPFSIPGSTGWIPFLIFMAIQAFLLIELIKIFIVIFKHDNDAVEIAFPFKNGSFLITDGGNSRISRLMNYHFYSPVHKKKGTNNSMIFATDIVKTGSAKKTFFPLSNKDYPIFGEKVYSPVDGTVFKIENNINDNYPYSGDYPYNTGNTIIINKDNYYLLMGHLKKGSIKVKPGTVVRANDLLAESGNSGYSERPHIHIQLIHSINEDYWHGMGVSIRYNNRNLYKNRLIRQADASGRTREH
jgi:hypothetical protein